MGIPSLNSAILYNVSLYFHSNHANIANIPDLIHENVPFRGRGSGYLLYLYDVIEMVTKKENQI